MHMQILIHRSSGDMCSFEVPQLDVNQQLGLMAITHERLLPECSQETFGVGTRIRKFSMPQERQQTCVT